MSDMHSMDRENKKRRLRSNIVSIPDQNRPAYYEEEDSEEVIRRYQVGRRRKKLLIFLLVGAFLGIILFCFYKYQKEYQYSEYDVTWQHAMRYIDEGTAAVQDESGLPEGSLKNVSESGFVKFAYFGENMIKYTKDGATYIDATGKNIWTIFTDIFGSSSLTLSFCGRKTALIKSAMTFPSR